MLDQRQLSLRPLSLAASPFPIEVSVFTRL